MKNKNIKLITILSSLATSTILASSLSTSIVLSNIKITNVNESSIVNSSTNANQTADASLFFEGSATGTIEYTTDTSVEPHTITIVSSTDVVATNPTFKSTISIEGEGDYNLVEISSDALSHSLDLLGVLTLPETLTKLGYSAFSYDTGISLVKIPASLIELDSSVFYCCTNLQSVEFEPNSQLQTIENSVFAFSGLTKITIPSSITKLNMNTFFSCSNLKSVEFELGSQIETIGDGVFQYCSSLGSIVIPSSVTSIGSFAFSYCSNLKSVEFEDINNSKLSTIKSKSFERCDFLSSFIIPSSVTTIQKSAFKSLLNFSSITLNWYKEQFSNLSLSETWLEECNNLKTVLIPYGQKNAYEQNRSLLGIPSDAIITEVTSSSTSASNFLDGDVSGDVLYTYNSDTNTLNIVGTAENFSANNLSIKSVVTINDAEPPIMNCSNISIGNNAFDGCQNISSISIPSNITNIGYNAFANITGINTIYLNWTEDQLPTVASEISSNNWLGDIDSSKITVYVPSGSITTYKDYASQLGIDDSFITDGTNYFIKASEIFTQLSGEEPTGYIISDNFNQSSTNTIIKGYYGELSLVNATLEPTKYWTGIGSYAFNNCSGINGSFDLSKTMLTDIQDNAFNSCVNLTTFIFTIKNYISEYYAGTLNVGENAFNGCIYLNTFYMPFLQEAFDVGLININENWLGDASGREITIHIPKGMTKTYKNYLKDKTCGATFKFIDDLQNPEYKEENNNLALGLGLGLGLGIPVLAGTIGGTIYGVKKHKGKK